MSIVKNWGWCCKLDANLGCLKLEPWLSTYLNFYLIYVLNVICIKIILNVDYLQVWVEWVVTQDSETFKSFWKANIQFKVSMIKPISTTFKGTSFWNGVNLIWVSFSTSILSCNVIDNPHLCIAKIQAIIFYNFLIY